MKTEILLLPHGGSKLLRKVLLEKVRVLKWVLIYRTYTIQCNEMYVNSLILKAEC